MAEALAYHRRLVDPAYLRTTLPSESRYPGQAPMTNVLLAVVAPVVALFFAQALERHDLLILSGVEHDHPLGRASGDADACDWRANELAAIGHQHHLIGFFHRERPDDLAGLFGQCHRDDAFAATAGRSVFVGRGAFAKAAFGHRQHKLLGRGEFDIALLAEFDGYNRLLGVGTSLLLGRGSPADRTRAVEIGRALLGGNIDVLQDRQRDHVIFLGQRNTANAA